MKKLLACVILTATLFSGAVTVSAVPSPTGTPTHHEEEPSPKTSDFNIHFIEVLGAILAGSAAFTWFQMKKYE